MTLLFRGRKPNKQRVSRRGRYQFQWPKISKKALYILHKGAFQQDDVYEERWQVRHTVVSSRIRRVHSWRLR